ncbi:hypothetical protein Tco_0584698, partial [Tanacetum coccineum]
LAAHELFVAIFSCYRSFSFSSVPIGIVSIYQSLLQLVLPELR